MDPLNQAFHQKPTHLQAPPKAHPLRPAQTLQCAGLSLPEVVFNVDQALQFQKLPGDGFRVDGRRRRAFTYERGAVRLQSLLQAGFQLLFRVLLP